MEKKMARHDLQDDEPLVLARPIYYAERASCEYICAALQKDYDMEHERLNSLFSEARHLHCHQNTLRYMLACYEDHKLQTIFTPQHLQVKSEDFLEQCQRASFSYELVDKWILENKEKLEAWENRPWISLPPFIDEAPEERVPRTEIKRGKLEVSTREKIIRMMIFVVFVGIGLFLFKSNGCSRIMSLLQ